MFKLTTLMLLVFGLAVAQEPEERAYKIPGEITAPKVLYKVDPDYTPKPNAPKIEGTVLLAIVVDTDGLAHDIRIKRSQGEGPDKSAIAAVEKWRFQPGRRYGNPVNVPATVEVNFPQKAVRPQTPGLLRVSARFMQPE